MKKMKFLMLAIGVIFMASCQKASEKAAGTYTGSYIIFSSTYPGNTATIIASGEAVNVTLSVTQVSVAATANGVTATNSGDNVSISYSSTSTTDGDITAISGTYTTASKALALSFTYRAGGSPISGTFSGTKP